MEGDVRDKLFVLEGVFQTFGVVGCIFDIIGESIVLVYRKGQQEDRQNGPSIDRNIKINRPAHSPKSRKKGEMEFISEEIVRHGVFYSTIILFSAFYSNSNA